MKLCKIHKYLCLSTIQTCIFSRKVQQLTKKGEFILCAQRTLETPLATKIEIPGRGEGQPQKQIYEDSRLSNGFQHGPSFFETVENWETISQDQVKWEIRCLLLLLFECCYYWPRILLHTLQSSILYSLFTMNTDHEEAEEEEEGHFFFAFYLHTSTFFLESLTSCRQSYFVLVKWFANSFTSVFQNY